MQANIHPDYGPVPVRCGCGHEFVINSTLHQQFTKKDTEKKKGKEADTEFKVDVCDQCHPFYTGKQKVMDTAGRVERFRKKYGASQLSADKNKPADQ